MNIEFGSYFQFEIEVFRLDLFWNGSCANQLVRVFVLEAELLIDILLNF